MDKTFKQRLEILPIKNIEHPVGNTKYYAAVHVKSLIAQADEEYQELFDKYSNLNDSYEKEVIRSSKLESQIIDLKSQQQALPVVPSFVADWYEFHMNGTFSAVVTAYAFAGDDKAVVWLGENGGMDLLCKMKLYGYTVEKPQLFYLKNKLTGLWLMRDEVDKVYPYDHTCDIRHRDKFAKEEIDSMQTGSYEQIEVAE